MTDTSSAYTEDELQAFGLQTVGHGARVNRTVQLFGTECIRIGAGVRIDAFAVITAGPGVVDVGDGAHISSGCSIFGTAGVRLGRFTGISPRGVILSTTDDFTDGHLAGPAVPASYRRVQAAPVLLGDHVILGTSSVVLPGVHIGRGATVGALSLVKDNVAEGDVVAGIPARRIGQRDLAQLNMLERELLDQQCQLAADPRAAASAGARGRVIRATRPSSSTTT